MRLGFFTNIPTVHKIEDIIERPPDENITAYSFVKQPFFHQALATNSYQKKKDQLAKRKKFFGLC